MRALSLIGLCLLLAAPAWAADTPSIAKGDSDYLDLLNRTYNQARQAVDQKSDINTETPPHEIADTAKANRDIQKAEDDCLARAVQLQTAEAIVKCLVDAIKTVRASEKAPVDAALLEAYSTTALRIQSDLKDRKITATKALAAFAQIDNIFLTSASVPVVRFLLKLDKDQSDTPPYDKAAVSAAVDASTAARATCENEKKNLSNTDLIACLGRSDQVFDSSIGIKDHAISGEIAALLTRGGSDADAGKLNREELLSAYGNWRQFYGWLIQLEYNNYLERHYAALFNRLYVEGERKNPKPADGAALDTAAAGAAGKAFKTAGEKCAASPDANINVTTLIACFRKASFDFAQALHLNDAGLPSAYDGAVDQLIADAAGGRLSDAELALSFQSIQNAYQTGIEKAYQEAEIADYVARFESDYQRRREASGPLPEGPPYDFDADKDAFAKSEKAVSVCNDKRESLGEIAYINCYLAARRGRVLADHRRDMDLEDAYEAATRAAANDSVAAKIDDDLLYKIYGALNGAEAAHEQKNLDDYNAFLESRKKVVVPEYVARFEGDYQRRSTMRGPLPEGRPYDFSAQPAAVAAQKAAATACESKRNPDNALPYIDCYLASQRNYVVAIHQRDMDLFEAYDAALRAAAADENAKKFDSDILDAIYAAIGDAKLAHEQKNLDDYNAWVEAQKKVVVPEYVARFEKDYNGRMAARGAVPEARYYTNDARQAAADTREKSYTTCKSAYDRKVELPYINCYLAARRTYYQAIRLRDMELEDAYEAALRGAAKDKDAGNLESGLLGPIYDAIGADELAQEQKALADYNAGLNRPVAHGYDKIFHDSYAAARSKHPRPSPSVPPLDASADKDAVAARNRAQADCDAQAQSFKSKAAWLACNLKAQEIYLATIRIVDTDMFPAYANTLRTAAADHDADRISDGEWDSTWDLLNRSYNDLRQTNVRLYQDRLNEPLTDPYLYRFDNAYFLASKKRKTSGAPIDGTALISPMKTYTQDLVACDAHRQDFKTAKDWFECQITATTAFWQAAKIQDQPLHDTYVNAMRQTAEDTDAGKLTREQSMAVRSRLASGMLVLLSSQLAVRNTQSRPAP